MNADKIINADKLKESIKNMHCSQCVCYDKKQNVCLDNNDCETYAILNTINSLSPVDSLRIIKNPCLEYSRPIITVNTNELRIKDKYESTLYSVAESISTIDVNLTEHFVFDTTDYTLTLSPPVEKIEKQEEGSDLYG